MHKLEIHAHKTTICIFTKTHTNRKIHIKYTRKAGRRVKRGNRGGAWTQAEIANLTKQSITN